MLPFLLETIQHAAQGFFMLFGYISGSNSFPQPLSSEEEMKYMQLYKNGSEEARNTLIERNLRLVAHIVKKYSSSGSESDDLISIGTIGLIKAITTFDQSKGTRLATYAARCIEKATLACWKHSGPAKLKNSCPFRTAASSLYRRAKKYYCITVSHFAYCRIVTFVPTFT